MTTWAGRSALNVARTCTRTTSVENEHTAKWPDTVTVTTKSVTIRKSIEK